MATSLVAPDGSWCEVDREPGPDGRRALRFAGPQHLWERVESAWRQWATLDRPAWSRFGITATPDRHSVWLDNPAGPAWPLPTPPDITP